MAARPSKRGTGSAATLQENEKSGEAMEAPALFQFLFDVLLFLFKKRPENIHEHKGNDD